VLDHRDDVAETECVVFFVPLAAEVLEHLAADVAAAVDPACLAQQVFRRELHELFDLQSPFGVLVVEHQVAALLDVEQLELVQGQQFLGVGDDGLVQALFRHCVLSHLPFLLPHFDLVHVQRLLVFHMLGAAHQVTNVQYLGAHDSRLRLGQTLSCFCANFSIFLFLFVFIFVCRIFVFQIQILGFDLFPKFVLVVSGVHNFIRVRRWIDVLIFFRFR